MTFTVNSRGMTKFFYYNKAQFSYDDFIAIPVGNKVLIAFKDMFTIKSTNIITADGKYSFDGVNFESNVSFDYKLVFYTYATLTFAGFVKFFNLNSDDVKAHFNVTDIGDVNLADVGGYSSDIDLQYRRPDVVTSNIFDSIKPSDDLLGRNTTTEALFANNMKINDSYPGGAVRRGAMPVRHDYDAPTIYFANDDNYVNFEARYRVEGSWVNVYPFNTFFVSYNQNRGIIFTGVEPYEPAV